MSKKLFEIVIVTLAIILVFMFISIKLVGFSVNVPSSVTIRGNETSNNSELPSVPSGGSSGGGGSGASIIRNFAVDKDLIRVLIKQGGVFRDTIEIKNTGNVILDVNLTFEGLNDFLISDKEFEIGAGETRVVNLDFFAKENENADAYTGRIIVRAGGIEKIVNVIVEVQEKSPLFDISTRVVDSRVAPGDRISAEIKMTNMGDLSYLDVLLYYALKDFEGNIILSKEESLAVNKKLEITREILLPRDITYGKYVFYSRITYGKNMTAASSDSFDIVSRESIIYRDLIVVGSLIFIVGLIVFVGIVIRRKTRV